MKALRKLLALPGDLWQMFVTYLPGPFGYWLRWRHWRRRLRACGPGARIDVGVHFQNPEWISLGEHCWIDRFVVILAGAAGGDRITRVKENPHFRHLPGEVAIGAHSHIAPYCVISGIGGVQIGACCGIASHAAVYSYSHHYRNAQDKSDPHQYAFTPLARPDQQAMVSGPVVLEDYCAVGLHAVLLPGTTLERGAWVASGAVVSGTCAAQNLVHEERKLEHKSLQELVIKT